MSGAAALPVNAAVRDDAAMRRFRSHLLAERNASQHTVAGYEQDIGQFAAFRWGTDAAAPFPWSSVGQDHARGFLMLFARGGARPTTTRRKLASMRSFFKYLLREGAAFDCSLQQKMQQINIRPPSGRFFICGHSPLFLADT